MTSTQFNTLVQMIAALSQRVETMHQEIHRDFATKQDLTQMTDTIMEAMGQPFQALEATVTKNHEPRLKRLETKLRLKHSTN